MTALRGIPPLRIGTHALIDAREFFLVVWLAVVLAVMAMLNLLSGRMGRAIRALRRGRWRRKLSGSVSHRRS